MIKIGFKAGPEQYPPSELLEYAIHAEEAGFDILEASDHFHPWSPEGEASFIWTWLGAVAAKTTKIEIGTGVTCPFIRYHPAIIAQAIATLESMAPKRVFLATGTGEALNEYASTGLWPEYTDRREMLREALELITALLTGEEITFNGVYYTTKKAKLYTRTGNVIPVYVSSLVEKSAFFAGKMGDGLITVGGEEPSLYAAILEEFAKGATSAQKEPAAMPKLIELSVAYTSNIEEAVTLRRRYWAGTLVPALFNQKIYTPALSAKNGQAVGDDTIQKKVCISDDPSVHIQFAKKYIDMGFNYLFFHSAGPDQHKFIEEYGKYVIPELKKDE